MDAWNGVSQLIVITCAPLPHKNVLGCEAWHKTYNVVSETDVYTTSEPLDDWVTTNIILSNKEQVRDKQARGEVGHRQRD